MEGNLLGQLLIENKFITKEQLDIALEKQKNSPLPKLLGSILVEEGIITQRALDMILHIQKRKSDEEGIPALPVETPKPAETPKPEPPAEAKKAAAPAPPAEKQEKPPSSESDAVAMLEKRIDELEGKMKKMKKHLADSLTEELKRYVRQAVRRASKGK